MLNQQNQNQYFLFNFEQPKTEQTQFFQVQFWQQQGRILGCAKGRGITWFLQTKDLLGVNCALRHYYRGGLWGKFNKDLYLFTDLEKTRSFAELYLLQRLWQAGLPVPKPIGARIEKCWFGYRADILLEKIENTQDLTVYLQKNELSSNEWRKLGALIRQLHNQQICHTDLNAHNILFQSQQQKFWLIDFDKCGEKEGDSWKAENLARLKRSFEKEILRLSIHFKPSDWQDFLLGYQI